MLKAGKPIILNLKHNCLQVVSLNCFAVLKFKINLESKKVNVSKEQMKFVSNRCQKT